MSSFKNKFASLVQDLRNKKSKEFSRQPQPAYSEHFAQPPPPPPPIPQEYKTQGRSEKEIKAAAKAAAKAEKAAEKSERPPSRSGSILRKIGSRTSLRELRRKSSFGGTSSTEVNNYGLQTEQPPVPTQDPQTRQQSVELTPPPSAGKKSPPPLNTAITQNQHTPPSGSYDDSEDDLYSDPVRDRLKAEAAAKAANQLPSPPSEAPPPPPPQSQQTYSYNGPPQRPQMFIPGTNSQILPTIPASPASTMASPSSPTGGTNPFRKFGSASPNLAEVADGPFKPISPVLEQKGFESPTLNTQVPRDLEPETASPTTATKGLMNGLHFSFAPPPVDSTPAQITPPTSTHSSPSVTLADNNPFKDLTDETSHPVVKPAIKAIAPPSLAPQRPAPPPPAPAPPLERTLSGKTPQFKRAPSGRAAVPEGFAPPPPPPMALPHGWTARWDEKEQKFAYYQGTRSKSEQWDMPTEPAKKMSMRDRRMKKKKEVKDTISNLPSYAEASSPTAGPSKAPAASNLVEPNPSS
ncbi:hypothetical protein ABW19_dt0208100 [Dactylella cylindrospora]|nr:hypothetical protein ABW19_dt0208100 [Dactylella cylindrospora]